MQSFEKLNSFYLGRVRDTGSGETAMQPLLYDAKDLTTHALCVGMTGSGKTGLCVSLLEEAALDGIPAIVIDPKGDMGNLLLSFPELAPSDFAPWIDPSAAQREGLDEEAHAEKVATRWREGLATWGQDGERIRRMRAGADLAIYTPGSNVGLPLTVLRSFDAPPAAVLEDPELLADRIEGATLGLLSLAGIEGDTAQSREFVLLSNLLNTAWREGRGLALVDLITQIQEPPFTKLGVLELETFYPSKERFKLAMRLNNLLASPSFAGWLEGDALDVQKLLWTEQGNPRISILSIAHLSDSERMFFVSTLLHEVLAWMRRQSGTSSLRAILYMDEIFGFFPPSANPPSKKPMLTLLKQARAFGLGVVLATQNPVDIDYKGLSNIGTWFLGRLQTDQDKRRVLDGLDSAGDGAGPDRAELDRMLSGLGKRQFLMSNVHDDEPVTFETRWAMSFLRGPLDRGHVETLMADRKAAAKREAPAPAAIAARPSAAVAKAARSSKPVLAEGAIERYLATDHDGAEVLYRPALHAHCRLHFVKASAKVDEWRERTLVIPLDADLTHAGDLDWTEADAVTDLSISSKGVAGARYAELPPIAGKKKSFQSWGKALKNRLYSDEQLVIRRCKALKLVSRADESEADFKIRLADATHEKRDEELAKLRERFGKKLATVQERIRKAEERLGREEGQVSQRKSESLLSVGAGLLGALFGRKLASASNVSRASSSMRSVGRISKEKGDVDRAKAELAARQEQLSELEIELETAIEDMEDRWHTDRLELDETPLAPRKSDIEISGPELFWLPWRIESAGTTLPAFELTPAPRTSRTPETPERV